jgi:hypothetical protein
MLFGLLLGPIIALLAAGLLRHFRHTQRIIRDD